MYYIGVSSDVDWKCGYIYSSRSTGYCVWLCKFYQVHTRLDRRAAMHLHREFPPRLFLLFVGASGSKSLPANMGVSWLFRYTARASTPDDEPLLYYSDATLLPCAPDCLCSLISYLLAWRVLYALRARDIQSASRKCNAPMDFSSPYSQTWSYRRHARGPSRHRRHALQLPWATSLRERGLPGYTNDR